MLSLHICFSEVNLGTDGTLLSLQAPKQYTGGLVFPMWGIVILWSDPTGSSISFYHSAGFCCWRHEIEVKHKFLNLHMSFTATKKRVKVC